MTHRGRINDDARAALIAALEHRVDLIVTKDQPADEDDDA